MTRQYTSREFNQDVAAAKRASRDGPVVITDRGQPAHVLLNYDEYRRLTGKRPSLADMLSWSGTEDIDLDSLIPKRPVDPRHFQFED